MLYLIMSYPLAHEGILCCSNSSSHAYIRLRDINTLERFPSSVSLFESANYIIEKPEVSVCDIN